MNTLKQLLETADTDALVAKLEVAMTKAASSLASDRKVIAKYALGPAEFHFALPDLSGIDRQRYAKFVTHALGIQPEKHLKLYTHGSLVTDPEALAWRVPKGSPDESFLGVKSNWCVVLANSKSDISPLELTLRVFGC